MFIALILIVITVGLIEGIPLARKKLWKEVIVVFSLLVIAVLIGTMKLFEMPSPLNILANALSPIGKAFLYYKK